jgi:hypothetical protein
MKARPLELTLLAIALIGGGLTGQTGWERARLTKECDRLVQLTGDLTITDPAKLQIQAIETGTTLDFAWRIYVPPNYQLKLRGSTGGSSSSSSSNARYFVARVRFRGDDQGLLQVFSAFEGGNTLFSIGDERLAKLLEARWREIRIEQLGAREPVRLLKGESAVLLRLSLPDDILAEARQKLTTGEQTRLFPTLYELKLGPDPPQ